MDIQILTIQQYESLIKDATVIVRDRFGDKVLMTKGGDVCKIFRRKKRWLTSASWCPPAIHFVRNANVLHERGIPTVQVKALYQLFDSKRMLVQYGYLRGLSFRDLPPQKVHFIELARFFAKLHQHGIYFRSLHLGNVLQLSEGNFALIDISDMSFVKGALSVWKRARNFKPILRRHDDLQLISQFGIKNFLDIYLKESKLSWLSEKLFLRLVALYNPQVRNTFKEHIND